MRLVTIRLDCGEKYCEECEFGVLTENAGLCDLFDVDLVCQSPFEALRCRLCLERDVGEEKNNVKVDHENL